MEQIRKAPANSNNNKYAKAKRYGKRTITILVAILVALVAIGLCGFRFAYNAMLPDVIEMTEAEATALLEDYDMEVQVQRDWSDKYEEGLVISQDPKGGAQASAGETVTIVISKGPESVTMPEFVGISKEEAIENLNQASVSWMVSEAYSDKIPAGSVISQMPKKGEEVFPGESVLLVISKGERASVRIGEDIEVTKGKSNSNKTKTSTSGRTTSVTSASDEDDEETTETTYSSNSSSRSSSSNKSNSSSSSSSSKSSGSNSSGKSSGSSSSGKSSGSSSSGSSSSSSSDLPSSSQSSSGSGDSSSPGSSQSDTSGSSDSSGNTDSGSSTPSSTDNSSGNGDSSNSSSTNDASDSSGGDTGSNMTQTDSGVE